MTREPSRTPGVPGNYHVNSAEVGMTRLALYTEEDHKFDAFMKEKGEKCDDTQIVLSGPGLKNVFDYYHAKVQPSQHWSPEVKPEQIVEWAKLEF